MRGVISATVLRDAIEAASTLVDEARLWITGDGITIRAVDPANVAFVALDLKANAFESYEATDREIGVDLERLSDILGTATKEDKVELCLNESKLEARIGGLSYTMSLLDPSSIKKEPRVPSLDLPARIVLNGALLRQAVKAAEKVSGTKTGCMTLGVADGAFYAESMGEFDSFRLEPLSGDDVTVESKANVSSKFSLDYLDSLVKIMGKAERVAIDLGTDHPVRFGFDVSSGCNVVYLLAPRIEGV